MGTVVYSTSPLQAFLWTFVGLGVLVLLGLFVGVSTFFNRKAKAFNRIATIVASVLVLAIGCAGIGFTFISMNGNAVKVSLLLDKKQVVQQSCGDNGDTCEHNQLSMHDSTGKDYEFKVPQKAYDATEEQQCYAVTYYPNKGLSNLNGTDTGYIYSEYVTQIELLDRSACP